MAHTSVNQLPMLIGWVGLLNCFMVKANVKKAYQMVPVHLDDRPLLGLQWKGEVWLDTVLPFGQRSATKIFSAVADALQWIMVKQGIYTVLHYLDDFMIVARSRVEAQKRRELLMVVWKELGVLIENSKLEGP